MSKLARQGRMSSQSPRGVRTAAALGAASLGLLALSGCEQPRPMATATVGGDSVSTEASCYNDGKTIPKDELRKCLSKAPSKTISVDAAEKVRIGVPPETADAGWQIFADGDPMLSETLKKTYYSFVGEVFFQSRSQQPGEKPSGPKKSINLTLVQTSGGDFKGVWHFTLKNTAGE
ncbi:MULTISPECIES: hypothetical protein [Streptomyces]|nr:MULTISPECIES: hypothetical protein [Streptomyces]